MLDLSCPTGHWRGTTRGEGERQTPELFHLPNRQKVLLIQHTESRLDQHGRGSNVARLCMESDRENGNWSNWPRVLFFSYLLLGHGIPSLYLEAWICGTMGVVIT